jgi:hypothetical protein
MNQRTGSLFSLQTRYPLSAPDLAHVVVPHRIADHLIFIPRDIGFRILENQGIYPSCAAQVEGKQSSRVFCG